MSNGRPSSSSEEKRAIAVGLKANTRLSAGLHALVAGFLEAGCASEDIARISIFSGRRGKLLVGWGEEEVHSLIEGYDVAVCAQPAVARGRIASSLYDASLFSCSARRENLDVLLCPGNVAVRVPGVKTIFWPQTVLPLARKNGELSSDQRKRSVKAKLFERLLLTRIQLSCRNADGLIFSSDYARELYRRVLGVEGKTAVIHPPGRRLPRAVREGEPSLGSRQKKTILFASTILPYKMVYEMVLGFREFARSGAGHGYRLAIVGREGDQAYTAKVDRLIADSGLGDSVVRLGYITDQRLSILYRDCSIFLFPSACENAGSFALLDALAHGKVVLCSELSSMPELCGDAALYFDPRKPGDITECLREITKQPHIAGKLRARALVRSRQLGDWDRVVDDVVSFARTVLVS